MVVHFQAHSAANGCSRTRACSRHEHRASVGRVRLWLVDDCLRIVTNSFTRLCGKCEMCIVLPILFIFLLKTILIEWIDYSFTYDFFLLKWLILFPPFLLFSTWKMTWCASLTVRLMTSWTVSLKSRPLWSPPLYPQSSHHLCQTRRGTNSGFCLSNHPGSVCFSSLSVSATNDWFCCFLCRYFRPPHGQGKQFVSRRSLLE